jgi:hypothetical protein
VVEQHWRCSARYLGEPDPEPGRATDDLFVDVIDKFPDRHRHPVEPASDGARSFTPAQHQDRNAAADRHREAAYPLFDHLVGAQQERFRDRETDRLGGLEIDDKLEFGWILDR